MDGQEPVSYAKTGIPTNDFYRHKPAEETLRLTLDRSRRQQAVVADLAMSPAVSEGDVEALAKSLTERAARASGVERVGVWLFENNGATLRCIDLYEASLDRHSTGAILREDQFRAEYEVLKTAKYVDANDPLTDPRTAGYVETYLKPLRITSMLDAAIRASGLNLGTLCLEHVDTPHRWEPDEITFACQLADQVALTILNRNRRVAEEALRESERRFRDISEAAGEYICETDAEGHITYISDRVMDVLGYRPEELLGRRPFDSTYSYDAEDIKEFFTRHARDRTGFRNIEQQAVTASGRTVWLSVTAVPILNDRNRLIGYRGAAMDITERKRAEEALRESEGRVKTILSSLADLVFGLDQEGRFVFYHVPPGAKLYLHPEQFMGKNYSEVMPDFLAAKTREALEANRRNEIFVMDYSLPIDGQTAWFSAKISPILIQDAYRGSVVVARDVTESRRAQIELNEFRDKMARAEQLASIGMLSANLVHQINQPLTALRLFLQQALRSAQEKSETSKVVSNLKDSLVEVSNVISITDQFLRFAREPVEAGPGSVDLDQTARRIVRILSEVGVRSNLGISLERMDRLPPVPARLGEIEQVFFILIQNAIQAARGRKDCRLTISAERQGDRVDLRFADTCGGIDPECLPKIFDPFFTTKPPGLGTGLGLCILNQIVTRYGGKVRVENQFGAGSTFVVSLPLTP